MRKITFNFSQMTGDDFRKVMSQKMSMAEYLRMMERVIGPDMEWLRMDEMAGMTAQFTPALTEYLAELMDRVHDAEMRSLLADVNLGGGG